MNYCFKKRILNLSCALLLASTGVLATEDNSVDLPMGKDSHNKTSLKPGNLEIIESFRDFYRNHSDGKDTDKSLVEHQETFIPFARFLLETMNKEKQNSYLEELQNEVKAAITKKRISPDWLIDMHFRFLALDGMLESERDVFNHVPYHKYLDALLETDFGGKPVVVDIYKWGLSLDRKGEYFHTGGENNYWVQGVSEKAHELIEKAIAKHLQAPIIYPSLNEGILPITLILRNWLKEIYHIGMPTQNIKDVHGEENTSKVGFAFHDLFHYKNDKRRWSLYQYICDKVGSYVISDQGFAADIIPQLVPLAVQKYNLIMEALEKAYFSIETDNYAVAGFFTLAHEVSVFSPEVFDISNPVDLIDAMVKKGLSYYSELEIWENPEDPLFTSLEGDTSLNDEMIVQLAIGRLAEDTTLNLPYQIYEKKGESGEYIGYVNEKAEQRELRKAWLPKNTRAVAKKTPQFIDVVFEFADGQEKTITYPTLNRKWKNVNASLGLLSFATGERLIRPNLEDQNSKVSRENALKFIGDVQEKLKSTITDFAKKAKTVFGEDSKSFAEEYTAKFEVIDEQMSGILKISAK